MPPRQLTLTVRLETRLCLALLVRLVPVCMPPRQLTLTVRLETRSVPCLAGSPGSSLHAAPSAHLNCPPGNSSVPCLAGSPGSSLHAAPSASP